MSDLEWVEFSPVELFEAAQGNFHALSFAVIVYLKAHHLSTLDFWRCTGESFARNWGRENSALELAKEWAFQWASVGACLVDLVGDETHALATLDWPPDVHAVWHGITPAEADEIFEIVRPVAAHLGFDYEWKREDDRVSLVFTRR